MYKVYKHTTPSKKVYIGITNQKPERRWGKNGRGYKDNDYFYAEEIHADHRKQPPTKDEWKQM